jgi:hypothetical protein
VFGGQVEGGREEERKRGREKGRKRERKRKRERMKREKEKEKEKERERNRGREEGEINLFAIDRVPGSLEIFMVNSSGMFPPFFLTMVSPPAPAWNLVPSFGPPVPL